MKRQKRDKLNHLLKKWPPGTVAVQRWLEQQGVSRQLVRTYQKSQWVERLGHGAFIKAGDRVVWTGGVYAIQAQLHLPIHVGGRTALYLKGQGHFLPMDKGEKISLFGVQNVVLPQWFRRYDWKVRVRYVQTNLFPEHLPASFSQHDFGSYTLRISSRERAIMEVLHLVPQEQSLEEATLLMEGLTTLRPKLVQTLLEQCRSIKVKRLFLYLAERCQRDWIKQLKLSRIDLGKGNRVIIPGGHFDSKYQITVSDEAREKAET